MVAGRIVKTIWFRPAQNVIAANAINHSWNGSALSPIHWLGYFEAIAKAGYELVTQKLAARVAWPRLIDEVIGSE